MPPVWAHVEPTAETPTPPPHVPPIYNVKPPITNEHAQPGAEEAAALAAAQRRVEEEEGPVAQREIDPVLDDGRRIQVGMYTWVGVRVQCMSRGPKREGKGIWTHAPVHK